ncbi:MAG: C10 family peptidase, partial [Bacteroidales bacterium]|nr:C10 family peptidase [Bacteroidales bacterium]
MKALLSGPSRCIRTRINLIVIFLALICPGIQAASIDTASALQVAGNFIQTKIPAKGTVAPSPQLVICRTFQGQPTYYIVNYPAEGGWVIVSGQDFTYPVLAYGTESCFELDSALVNPAAKSRLNRYHTEISEGINTSNKADKTIAAMWKTALSSTAVPAYTKSASGPLCTTIWDQDCNDNNSCPAMAGGPCGHALTGCVATAMGQVMKYYNYPARGTGSHSYTHSSLGTISASFVYSFDWDNMPDNLTVTTTDVDELLFRCGVSVDMDYGTGSSNAYTYDSEDAFEDYFYYNTSMAKKNRSSYTTANWKTLMRNEIVAGRPVLYRGCDVGGGGCHAWVLDGYDDSYLGTGVLYFHQNWGWGGSSNGWFLINDLTPGGYDFNDDEYAMTGIVPLESDLKPLPASSSITYSSNQISMGCTVWNDGTGGIARATQLGYYFSTNTTISPSDYLLTVDAVSILNPSYTSAEVMSINVYNAIDPIPPGVYYAGYYIDHLYEEDNEVDETNNDYLFGGTYTVNCEDPDGVSATDGSYYDRINVNWNSVSWANYYKVYRNTSNTTTGASALTSWQSGTSYADFNVQPGLTYYYFIKAATNSAGDYASDFSTGNSGYVSFHTLSSDVAQTTSTEPSYYQFTNPNLYWYAVGIRPVNLSDNWSMVMYSDAAMTSTLATSAYSNPVDFIVVDGNHTASAAKYVKGYRFSGTGNATVEYEGGTEVLSLGTPASYSWTAGDVVQVWDVYLNPGTYVFELDITSGSVDLDIGLFQSAGAAYHSHREARVAGSTTGGNGADEMFSFTVTTTDWYG